MAHLETIYKEKVIAQLRKEYGYTSIMQVPTLVKISLNIGLGSASQNIKLLEEAVRELTLIAGQKAVMTRAKKSIASFKLREGMPIGCRVTLRGNKMWDFYRKLVCFSLPRVRDFRGISLKGFDGHGNFTLGIKDHSIFPELTSDKIDTVKGMNISIVTTAQTDAEARSLLEYLGMPFRK